MIAKKLKVERDSSKLIEFANQKDFIYNLRICKNIFADNRVLKILVNSRDIKYSKYIREMVTQTLKIKEKLRK